MKMLPMMLPLACVLCLNIVSVRANTPKPLQISKAWVNVQSAAGVDTALMMVLTNTGDTADSLIRTRCAAATFTELRVVDTGEGVPAPRVVKAIPIGAKSSVTLTDQTAYVALLQITQALPAGTKFDCTLTFRQAGPRDVHVVAAKTQPAS